MDEIERTTILEKIFTEFPEKRRQLAIKINEFGIRCIGKHIPLFETLENEARNSGLEEEKIDTLVDELNSILNSE